MDKQAQLEDSLSRCQPRKVDGAMQGQATTPAPVHVLAGETACIVADQYQPDWTLGKGWPD